MIWMMMNDDTNFNLFQVYFLLIKFDFSCRCWWWCSNFCDRTKLVFYFQIQIFFDDVMGRWGLCKNGNGNNVVVTSMGSE